MQSNWTPCGNRLHPPCEEVEGANASYWHIVSFCCAAEFVRYRGIEDSDNPFPRKIYGSTLWLRHALFSESLVERTKIDHDSLVASLADLLFAVACRHFEVNSLSIDGNYLGRRAYLVAYRRGGEVLYIHCNTDGAFACVQKRPDGIERRVLHDQNHDGRRKYLRQHGVLESIGKVFGLHAQCRRSCGAQRNLLHLFVLDLDFALGDIRHQAATIQMRGERRQAYVLFEVAARYGACSRMCHARGVPDRLSVVALQFRPVIIQLREPSPANPDRLAGLKGKRPGVIGFAHCLD